MAKRIICASCGKPIIKNELYCGEEATYFEKKPLCEACFYEDEPVVTLYRGKNKEPYHITQTRNDTGGEFRALWHSSDPWRGRYQITSKSYGLVFSDAILSYHESESMLKELNDKAVEKLSKANIDFYRAFLRTSNLFCTDYDIWVKKDPAQILPAHLILHGIKKEVDYDNTLYSTGILFDRETLGKLQSMLGNKYRIEKDSDVMTLIEEKGEDFINEIKESAKAGLKRETPSGDSNV